MSSPIFTQAERKVSELVQNAINPRTLKDKAFKELKESLDKDREFIKARPIIVSMAEGRENTVIAGNMRLQAIKSLGWATVPVVEVRDASVEQEKEWMVKDNLHKGEWDFEALANNFDLDFLKEMGFDEKGLNKVLSNVDNSADDEFDAEKEAEAIKEPTAKLGDVWMLGDHRLACGDAGDAAALDRAVSGSDVALLLTDPPYGVKMDKGFGGSGGFEPGAKIKRREYSDGWDSERPPKAAFENFMRFAKASVIFGGNFFADMLPAGTHWIVWDKKQTMPTFGDCELAWTDVDRKSVKKYEVVYNGLIGKEKERFHPTQKPVKLMELVLLDYSKPGDAVLDPFLGSGTTLIACENTGRVCYGMEIDPKYVDVIIRRWEEKTGKKAVKSV